MSENNALVADAYLEPARWLQMEKLAQSLVTSKALPKDIQNAPQALVKMQAGLEMGLKPMESLTGLTIINGQVTPWGKTVVKLLRKAGWSIEYSNESQESCTATIKKDDEEYTETLTFEEAKLSKYVYQFKKNRDGSYKQDQNGNYVKELKAGWYEGVNRKLKLRYGALSQILKTQVPEALDGVADIAEVAEDFEIIEQVAEPTDKKHEEIITTTPDERKTGLAEFLEKNKNNPNKQPKPSEKDKKVLKTEENASNSEKKVAESKVTASDKAEAQEAEIVTNESKE